jgi:hypothetical protein
MTAEVAQIGTRKHRTAADGRLIRALSEGATVVDAARIAGVGRRTVYRRLADPAFREAVDDERSRLLDQVLDRLGAGSLEAVDALRDVLTNPAVDGATARVSAARAILGALLRCRETVELAQRIDALERQAQHHQWRSPYG